MKQSQSFGKQLFFFFLPLFRCFLHQLRRPLVQLKMACQRVVVCLHMSIKQKVKHMCICFVSFFVVIKFLDVAHPLLNLLDICRFSQLPLLTKWYSLYLQSIKRFIPESMTQTHLRCGYELCSLSLIHSDFNDQLLQFQLDKKTVGFICTCPQSQWTDNSVVKYAQHGTHIS